jgi:selenocysteine lyase/cysteine desulfurase
MVAMSAVHFSTGWRADLTSIGEFCRSRSIDLCVDAVQAVGVTPVDVRAMHVSFLAAGGHKWLTGPQGTGLLFVAADRWDMLRPSTPGWRSVSDCETDEPVLLPDARRYESGTSAVGQFLALGEGAQIITELTIDAIGSRVYQTSSYLVDQLLSCGAEVVSRRENDAWSGIIAFRIPEANPHDVRARCLEEGIVLGLRRGLLRASVHFYNSDEDVERLIAALRQFNPHANAPRAN